MLLVALNKPLANDSVDLYLSASKAGWILASYERNSVGAVGSSLDEHSVDGLVQIVDHRKGMPGVNGAVDERNLCSTMRLVSSVESIGLVHISSGVHHNLTIGGESVTFNNWSVADKRLGFGLTCTFEGNNRLERGCQKAERCLDCQ